MKQKITYPTRAAMLLLAVFFGFTGARADISTFPWTEDFNSLTVDYSIPDGWDNSEGTTPESYRWSYTSTTNNAGYGGCNGTSHDGSNCVRFNSNVNLEGYTNFLKTIPLNLPAAQNMELTFWYRNPKGGDFSSISPPTAAQPTTQPLSHASPVQPIGRKYLLSLSVHTLGSRLSLSSREHPTLATAMLSSTWTMLA